MKRVLAIILSLVMITSMTAISASASDMLVEITGKRTDSQVAFSVNIQNESATEQNAVVFLTSFENDGTFKNAEKFVVPVAANAEVYNTYVADISSQENVKILVWDDSLLPEAALSMWKLLQAIKLMLQPSMYGQQILKMRQILHPMQWTEVSVQNGALPRLMKALTCIWAETTF